MALSGEILFRFSPCLLTQQRCVTLPVNLRTRRRRDAVTAGRDGTKYSLRDGIATNAHTLEMEREVEVVWWCGALSSEGSVAGCR